VYSIPGSYRDQFSTTLGCDSTRTLNLTLKPCGIYFPIAFTPNKDGINETFKVLGDNFISQYDLKVFNRYGEIVFETTKPDIGWDGRFKGKDADIGVYVWLCQLKKPNSEQLLLFKGTITLLR
jgi:gliding motility-associated-like protein